MNCQLVQRRLLGIEDPARVPAEVRSHLAYCDECRDWHDQLLLLERNAIHVPVPTSRRKGRFLRQLIHTSPGEARTEPVTGPRRGGLTIPVAPWSLRQTSNPSYRAAALVAAVVLIALGWGIFHFRSGPPQPLTERPRPAADPLLASLVQRNVRLATAHSAQERIEVLADMAQELQDTSRALAQAEVSEHLEGLAALYDQLVREGILKQALALPASERRPILSPLADRFARTARIFDLLVEKLPAAFSKPLHTIAAAAREGNRHLFGLLGEARS